MRCAWENADFPDDQFRPYRGLIKLHIGVDPVHLTNGELRDGSGPVGADVDIAAGPVGSVDIASDDEAGEIH